MGSALRRNVPAMAAGGLLTVAVAAVAVAGASFAQADERPAAASQSADSLEYQPIEEPFGTPVGACDPAGTTIEMTNCYLEQVVEADQAIDVLQNQRFTYALSTEDRQAYLEDDAEWLAGRLAEVRKIDSGGTLDMVTQAQKTLELSEDRLASLQ